jgi:tRNA(adenine34) deaminase
MSINNKGFFHMTNVLRKCLPVVAALLLVAFQAWAGADADPSLAAIEARLLKLRPHPEYKDDGFGIIVIKQALVSLKEGSGGIGACLVDEKNGTVVVTGRNRQYRPYFRSDLHAEMDLLTRYEDWLRKKGGKTSGGDPRDCDGLVLVSSVEPCPMCLTRIINAGIKKMIYVTPDESGGMVSRMNQLPPFWRQRAAQCEYRQAECSPEIQRIARDLFDFSARNWGMNKEERK